MAASAKDKTSSAKDEKEQKTGAVSGDAAGAKTGETGSPSGEQAAASETGAASEEPKGDQGKAPSEPPAPEEPEETPTEPAADGLTGEDAPEGQEVKYTVARLIVDAYDLTGYPSHYAAGALSSHDAADELTAAGAKSAIKKWLKGDIKDEDSGSEGETQ